MKDKRNLLVTTTGIIGMIIITASITYAFFNYTKQGTTENSITTGTITFLYTEIDQVGAGISIEDALPTTDEAGKVLTGTGNVFNFKITANTKGKAAIPYEVTARKKSDSTLDESVVRIYLTKVDGIEEELLLSNYNNLTQTTKINSDVAVEKTIYTGRVTSNTEDYEKNFRLRMWLDNSVDFSSGEYNGKTFTLTINVYANATVVTDSEIAAENRAEIYNITVDGTEITPVANADYQFITQLPKGTTSTSIEIATDSPNATVNIKKLNNLSGVSNSKKYNVRKLSTNRTLELTDGINLFEVSITSENGKVKNQYILKIKVGKNSDATLKSLSVNGYTLAPTFGSNITSYDITVPYNVTEITVNGEPNDSEASYTVENNNNFVVGTNTVNVKVIAEDDTEKTYTIIVNRSEDTTNTLKSLSLSGCILSPIFSKNITSYLCTVTNNIESTNVFAEATSSVGTITGTGIKSLTVGENVINIVSTSQSGIDKTYTVVVTRQGSNDTTLKSLSVSDYNIAPTFSNNTTSYALTVPYTTSDITINAVVNNNKASYIVEGNNNLVAGDNEVRIIVTAEDGTKKTYTILVTREKDATNTLKSLSIDGYSISPAFSSNITSYTATTEASSINITAAATSNVAIVTGTGTRSLVWGSNNINILVTAQDGTVKAYTITVSNTKPTAPVITGGSTNWSQNAKTISISTAGNALSGVKNYEYYKSSSTTAPTDSTTITGTTTGSLTVNDEGTNYIWYRTVSNNNNKSNWSAYQTAKIDTTNPSVTVTTTNKGAVLTLTDNYGVTGYNITSTSAVPSTWKTVSQTISTVISQDLAATGTYYAHVKDVSGRTNYKVFTVSELVLKNAIMAGYPASSTPVSITQTSSASNENGMYISTDTNSGNPTYFLRGMINNNYVNFAGQTWRIVRINEDGTIRMILNNGINNNTAYRYDSDVHNRAKMYYTNSSAKGIVDSWYNQYIKSYETYVATEMYCQQSRVVYASTNRTASNETIYSSYTPTFRCATDASGYGILNAKVGLLSVDEARYAGGQFYTSNTTGYLTVSQAGSWTMSPGGFDIASDNMACVWPLKADGSFGTNRLENLYALRPVINLNTNTTITGTGTSTDPYIVQ